MDKIYAQAKCECGMEIMEVEHWEEEKTFCFIQFKYLPIRHSFRRRLRMLFTGQVDFNEIFLDYKNAKQIADYINVNIKTNGEK